MAEVGLKSNNRSKVKKISFIKKEDEKLICQLLYYLLFVH